MSTQLSEAKLKVQPWKIVTIGNLLDANTARERCREADIAPVWGGDILDKMSYEKEESVITLACVTGRELGLKENRVSRSAVYAAAVAQGLALCPPEVGLQLWIQFPDIPAYDQGSREHLLVAMEPVGVDSKGYVQIFSLERTVGTCWLDALDGAPDRSWKLDCRWLFVLPE
jgi:hypothetical protein